MQTDGRAYGHVITNFVFRMDRSLHFLTHGAPLRALRARAPLRRCVKYSAVAVSINNFHVKGLTPRA